MFGVVPILGNHVNLKRDCYCVAWTFVVEAGKTSTLQPPTVSSFKGSGKD